jgi:hypothetical protein
MAGFLVYIAALLWGCARLQWSLPCWDMARREILHRPLLALAALGCTSRHRVCGI